MWPYSLGRTIKTPCMNLMNYLELYVVQEQEQFTFFWPITDGMKSTNSSHYNEHSSPIKQLDQCRLRVKFILHQIESLEHYLPETYQMLMNELDQQQILLKRLEIQDFYQRQDDAEQNQTVDSANQKQGQKQTYDQTRIPHQRCCDWPCHHTTPQGLKTERSAMSPPHQPLWDEYCLSEPRRNPLSSWTYMQALDYAEELNLPDTDWEFIHQCFALEEQ